MLPWEFDDYGIDIYLEAATDRWFEVADILSWEKSSFKIILSCNRGISSSLVTVYFKKTNRTWSGSKWMHKFVIIESTCLKKHHSFNS